MLKVYTCIRDDHSLVTLLVACLICVIGSIISLSVGQRAIRFAGPNRRGRLLLAGIPTGLTIWSTHFAAMLSYSPGVEVRFNGLAALVSVCLAMLIASCAWLIMSVSGRWRGYLGGGLIGLSLVAAHFIDMSALRLEGLVLYDEKLILLSLMLGFPFCVASGAVAHRRKRLGVLWAAGCLTTGTLTLHLVAMSAVTILPTAAAQFSLLDLGIDGLTLLVIASSTFILAVGAALAFHDMEVARATAADRERLERSEENHRYLIALNPQIPWITDPEGNVVEISPRWGDIVGAPVQEALGFGWTAKVHPDDLPSVASAWKAAIASGGEEKADARYRLQQADGSFRWFRTRAAPRRDANGAIVLWYGSLEDIHEQVDAELALRASEERYHLASLATNEVIWEVRAESDLIEWSGAVEEVLGYPEAKLGTSRMWWVDRIHPDDRDKVLAKLRSTMESGTGSWMHEFRFRTKAGVYVDLLSRGLTVHVSEGKPVRMVGSMMDITARKRSEEELRWAAHHDPLTHLPNRKLFAQKLDAALAEALVSGQTVGLAVVDVDGFKTLNDTLGHAAGDAALNEVAQRLINGAPSNAIVARLGGDEFAIILPTLAEPHAFLGSIRRSLEEMSSHISYDGQEVELSLSIGAALFPADGDNSESMLKSADLALYAAKAEGAGNVRLFQPAMRHAAEIEKRMRADARQALLDGQIVPYYQPKICLRSGAIGGFEALLRWYSPDRGAQSPASIRAAFDDPRLAPELTQRMLTQISDDMARWLDQGYDFGRIAMNGSPEDFRRGDLADRILQELGRVQVHASRFELEITETVFLGKRADDVGATLRTLRKEGVTIALDDFGTGYASLTHLKQFPVDVLKIDQSFVSRLISDKQQDAAIVGALIDLAKNLGIQTVAEGVETELQAFMLRRRGCDVGQGYHFARPMAAHDVPRFIEEWRPDRGLSRWSSRSHST